MKIKPEKSLGQNFLIDQEVVRKIIIGASLKKDDVVLEIGSGRGALTEALASKCQKVIAVEIDGRLAEYLKDKFKNNYNIEIVNEDILSHQSSIVGNKLGAKYKVVANIPYYITSPIIRKFLEMENPPQKMILMVQQEVAERICADPGKMSILAVSVQYYADPEILFYVNKNSFDPVPEVDSAVIKIVPYSSHPSSGGRGRGEGSKDADNFFRIVRAGFCAKRKTLANNLANSLHLERRKIENKLNQIGIAPSVRAQELSIENWKRLAELF